MASKKTSSQKYNAKIKGLKKKANDLWRIRGLELEPLCCVCGKKAVLRHHFIAKSLSNSLRFDIKNGISMCWHHHQCFHSMGDPDIYEAMTRNKSAEWFAHIKTMRRKEVNTNLSFYEESVKILEKL